MMEFSQKPKRAKRSIDVVVQKRLIETQHARRTKQTQGIALVVVLLSAMVLMVSMLAISATMAISSQRTTSNQRSTLQAQYAAEAGLALAKTRAAESFALFPLISVPTNTTMAVLQAAAVDFCGRAFDRSVNRATLSSPVRVCDNAGPSNGGTSPANRTYSIFVDYISSTAVTNAITAANTSAADSAGNRDLDSIYLSTYNGLTSSAGKTAFWRDIFSGSSTRSSITLPSPATGVTSSYTPTYGFIPYQVYAIPGGFRLTFSVAKLQSTATLKANGTTVTTRTLTADPAMPRISLDVARQCFCQYNYFANRRMVQSGASLVFGNYEKFYGRVHVNSSTSGRGAPSFYATSSSQYANFYGGFSTTASQRYWSPTNYENSISLSAMFHNNYRFNAESIIMPENAAKQKWAVIGGDPESTTNIQDSDLASAYGKSTSNFLSGVYYGNGQQKGTTWKGGIYVRGNVSDLRLTTTSTTPKKQVVTITQLPCSTTVAETHCVTKAQNLNTTFPKTITTFTQSSSNTWTMTEQVFSGTPTPTTPTATTTTNINSGFNGLIYVDGSIGSNVTQVGSALATTQGGLGGEGSGDTAVKRNLVNGVDVNNSRSNETPDIAPDIRLTVAARDDIYIKRNLTYADAPRDDDPNTVADESTYNMLGIYSELGNIKVDGVMGKPIKIDGTLMAVGDNPNSKANTITPGNGFGTIDYDATLRYALGGQKPTIELTGGIIEEQSQGVGQLSSTFSVNTGYDRDFDYDQRFANGKTPPFFPTQGQYTAACSEIALTSYKSALVTGPNDPEIPNTLRPCTRNSEEIWSPTKG